MNLFYDTAGTQTSAWLLVSSVPSSTQSFETTHVVHAEINLIAAKILTVKVITHNLLLITCHNQIYEQLTVWTVIAPFVQSLNFDILVLLDDDSSNQCMDVCKKPFKWHYYCFHSFHMTMTQMKVTQMSFTSNLCHRSRKPGNVNEVNAKDGNTILQSSTLYTALDYETCHNLDCQAYPQEPLQNHVELYQSVFIHVPVF